MQDMQRLQKISTQIDDDENDTPTLMFHINLFYYSFTKVVAQTIFIIYIKDVYVYKIVLKM